MTVEDLPFSQPRLLVSLARLLEHSESAADDAMWLSETIIQSLWVEKKTALGRQELIEAIYPVIDNFDAIAGLKFATAHHLIQTQQRPRRGRPRISRRT